MEVCHASMYYYSTTRASGPTHQQSGILLFHSPYSYLHEHERVYYWASNSQTCAQARQYITLSQQQATNMHIKRTRLAGYARAHIEQKLRLVVPYNATHLKKTWCGDTAQTSDLPSLLSLATALSISFRMSWRWDTNKQSSLACGSVSLTNHVLLTHVSVHFPSPFSCQTLAHSFSRRLCLLACLCLLSSPLPSYQLTLNLTCRAITLQASRLASTGDDQLTTVKNQPRQQQQQQNNTLTTKKKNKTTIKQ